MRRVKVRTYSGVVCEQEVFDIPDKLQDMRTARRGARDLPPRRSGSSTSWRFPAANIPAFLTPTLARPLYTAPSPFPTSTRYIPLRRPSGCGTISPPPAVRLPGCADMAYLGRGKATQRIHMHMVSEGVPEEYIRKQWYLGSVVRIEHLREHCYYDGVDHGQDYTGLANYLSTIGLRSRAGTVGGQPKTCGSRSGRSPRRSNESTASANRPRPPKATCWWRAGRPSTDISILNM